MNKLEVDVAEIKVEVAKIKMTMVEDWKVFGEVKIGFDEMKHAILKFIASHTNSTFSAIIW